MSLEKYTTLQTEHIQLLARDLAKRDLPVISTLEPIADFEELLTFSEANPTPIEFMSAHPAWRLESVASRIIEAVAIAAHEPLLDIGYPELARILLEHIEYLYAYPEGEARPRLEAGSALALAGCVCASLPQSDLWRLAGFGRLSAALVEVTPAATDSHLTLPTELAFLLANERNLPVLDAAVTAYNTVLKRDFTPQNQHILSLSDNDFFDVLNLDFPGMAAVKAAISEDDIPAAKSAYTAYRCRFLDDLMGAIPNPDTILLERSDTYTTAKTYLECLVRLSIHPTPAITATTEMGIAAHLFPEFRGSAQLRRLVYRRYKWIADAFFHPDGFHKDRTLRSQVAAIADFSKFLSVHGEPTARTDDLEDLQAFVEKLVETCLQLRQPDCSFPPLGRLPAPNFDAVELCRITDSSFRREDLPSPDTTSHALLETGCYVMRDNWKPDAQYLFFDARSSTFILHAHERHLATGSVRLLDMPASVPDSVDRQWITTPEFDWVEEWLQAEAVHHKRAIFYLKGEYFILHDLVLGEGIHTLEQVFDFGQGAAPHIDTGTGYTATQDASRSNLFIGMTGTTDLAATLDGNSVVYRGSAETPTAMNILLFPMKPKVKLRPTLSDIEVRTDPDVLATGFTLLFADTTDTILISDDGLAEMSAGDIRFIGAYLFLRRGASGAVHQFVMLNGRFLQVGRDVLVDLDTPRESYMRM